MRATQTRRGFLANVGRGALLTTLGAELTQGLGIARPDLGDGGGAGGEGAPARLNFGELEPLVGLMQDTPAERLLPQLVERLAGGESLGRLVAAGALANARSFGGHDYVGFHTMMALSPAYHMAQEFPAPRRALPVFKVLYRNTARIQARGGGEEAEVLKPIQPPAGGGELSAEDLRASVRQQDMAGADATFAALAQDGAEAAFNHLLVAVEDDTEVHRVVLPYRAWDLLGIVGREHAHTLLRQSVHYCVRAERWAGRNAETGPRAVLPKVLEEHRLMGREPGDRVAEDGWVDEMAETFFRSTPDQAAGAAAAALAEGMSPAAVGEAVALAANQLVLRDHGRPPRSESPGKPVGSVHGDSIGVHASDSANAWRNLAAASRGGNVFACTILGAYQVARDRAGRGGDFLNWKPLPVDWHLDRVKATDPGQLLGEAEEAIRGNLQAMASAVVHRYGELRHPPRPVFDLLLRYAVSEDGALHAEKFYRTVSEEFAASRPAFRWRFLVGLARVTASEYGRPAPGMAEARELLGV